MAEKRKRRRTGAVTLSTRAYNSLREGSTKMVTWGRDRWQSIGGGNQTGIITIATAGITAFFTGMDAVVKAKFLKDNWWFLPSVLIIIGWMLRRHGLRSGKPRLAEQGTTLLVAGVILFVQAWRNRPKAQDQQQAAQAQQQAASGQASGPDDAEGGVGRQWIQTEDGRFLRLGDGAAGSRSEAAARMAAALWPQAA